MFVNYSQEVQEEYRRRYIYQRNRKVEQIWKMLTFGEAG